MVTYELRLTGPERVFVVSGPNQGARRRSPGPSASSIIWPPSDARSRARRPGCSCSTGCFTHFEREADLSNLTGKLEDDLVTIGRTLEEVTPNSLVILNEIFTSTTLDDARFLGGKLMEALIELDLLAVFVTFVDEQASLGDSVVS